jgi:AcrR family transcriptional regulator
MELRNTILDAAIEEFLLQGYTGASLDAIIRKVGGSKTTIYTHFGGKQELFFSVVETSCKRILAPLRSIDLPKGALRDALFSFGMAFRHAILSDSAVRLYRLLVAEGGRFPQLARIFLDSGPYLAHRTLAAYLRREQQEGHFRADINTSVTATLFLDMISRDSQMRLLVGVPGSKSDGQNRKVVEAAISLLLGEPMAKK